ncbi:MAG: dTDP-4-dehydrorhamnose 3,5-epimerase family protein [Rikenellaceae bacterium]
MSKFTVKNTPTIEGPKIIRPEILGETRNYLSLNEQSDEIFASMSIEDSFEELYSEKLARGVLRGLYFQRKDSYAKLLSVSSGSALCVAVDLRPESKSFGAANSVELNAENETSLYVPAYFAIGYLSLEPSTEVVVHCAGHYDPAAESGIIYDDEILSINWQFERYEIDQKRLNINQRDKKFPSFRSYNQNSLWVNRPKKSKYALSRIRVHHLE